MQARQYAINVIYGAAGTPSPAEYGVTTYTSDVKAYLARDSAAHKKLGAC